MKHIDKILGWIAVLGVIAILIVGGCKESNRDILPNRCIELWGLANGSYSLPMTKRFMRRCCELIDGNDTEKVSSDEGLCLIDLVDPPKKDTSE